MFQQSDTMFMIVETPLHAGSGSDMGLVDLPIQRERHTGHPKIESSSLKGALREAFEISVIQKNTSTDATNDGENQNKLTSFQKDVLDIQLMFGYDGQNNFKEIEEVNKIITEKKLKTTEFAGALSVTDGRILLFPVRSMKGVFSWTTSFGVLNRLLSDIKMCNVDSPLYEGLKKLLGSFQNNIQKSQVCMNSSLVFKNQVFLEEFSFPAETDEQLETFAKGLGKCIFGDDSFRRNQLVSHICILPDDDFTDLTNLSTEVVTRNKIDNKTGAVDNGALFSEEYLPSNTVMYSNVFASPVFNDEKGRFSKNGESGKNIAAQVAQNFKKDLPKIFVLGGGVSHGKGLIKPVFLSKSNHGES